MGKIPRLVMSSDVFVDRLDMILGLPGDLSELRTRLKADPNDGDAARPRGDDPEADRWAAVDVVIGDEFQTRRELDRATEWYARAIDSAKRPVDAFLAHWGAGLAAGLREGGEEAEAQMAAALAVPGVSEADRAFVQSFLKRAKEAREAREAKAEPTKPPPEAK